MLRKEIALIICSLLIFFSCNTTDSLEPLQEEPFITGVITEMNESSVLIEENPEVSEPGEPGGSKIWLGIVDETKVLMRHEDGTLSEFGEEKLSAGQQVEGWIDGVIIDTSPQQGTAKRIVVISSNSK